MAISQRLNEKFLWMDKSLSMLLKKISKASHIDLLNNKVVINSFCIADSSKAIEPKSIEAIAKFEIKL